MSAFMSQNNLYGSKLPYLSIIIPVYNDAEALQGFLPTLFVFTKTLNTPENNDVIEITGKLNSTPFKKSYLYSRFLMATPAPYNNEIGASSIFTNVLFCKIFYFKLAFGHIYFNNSHECTNL